MCDSCPAPNPYWESGQKPAPEGYNYTGEFRIPSCGEYYLGVARNGEVFAGKALVVLKPDSARWILLHTYTAPPIPKWELLSTKQVEWGSEGKTYRVTTTIEVISNKR